MLVTFDVVVMIYDYGNLVRISNFSRPVFKRLNVTVKVKRCPRLVLFRTA